MKTVVGLLPDARSADVALGALSAAGFAESETGLLIREPEARAFVAASQARRAADTGTVGGAVAGGLVGLLAGLSAVSLPGIGPAMATGTLATALGSSVAGAGVGAVTGRLLGVLLDQEIPEAEAHVYAESLRRGSVLITVRVPESRMPVAENILRHAGALDVDEYRRDLEEEGWQPVAEV